MIQIVVAPRPPRCVLRARGAFCTHIACDESAPLLVFRFLVFLGDLLQPQQASARRLRVSAVSLRARWASALAVAVAYCSCNLLSVRTVFLDPHILFPTIWTRLTVPVRSEKFGNDFAHACINDVCLAVFLRVRVDTSLVACKRAPLLSPWSWSSLLSTLAASTQ